MPVTVSSSNCNQGCLCHHDASGRSQPPCYTCTIHQCSQAYRFAEPSAPPEDVLDDERLQVPPEASAPSADAQYGGWRSSLNRNSSTSNRTIGTMQHAVECLPATYQEDGVTTIQVSGTLLSSSTPPDRSFREIFVRLPSETAVAHSYPALSKIVASNEPTLLIATEEGTTQHLGNIQEAEDFPDDVTIDYSMSEESSDSEEDLINNESNRINQFPLPRISVPKKSKKHQATNNSKLAEDGNNIENYTSSKTKSGGLLKTIIRNNSAWGSSEDSSLSSKYKVKGKMCKQNHLNIQGIVHQHYALHKENRTPVYDTRKKTHHSRNYEERWQNLHTWMGHVTSN